MENNVKIVAGYIINQPFYKEAEIKQYLDNIATYINQVDYLYIYNTTTSPLTEFLERLSKYPMVEYANCPEYGEAEIYQEVINQGLKRGADYVTYLAPGYFYEDSSLSELKKYLLTADTTNLAVITPMPLYACQIHERKAEEFRTVKGCRLLGALLNLKLYPESNGIRTEYYQTTFDYEYCLQLRSKGYYVMLAQNLVLRNQNYKVITRKLGMIKLSAYDRDLMDVYYETRNRYYLWKEYKTIDYDYVKLDKKLARREKQEIRTRDKHYKEKFRMMKKAKVDYKQKHLGRYVE